jgi:hypothetical protein
LTLYREIKTILEDIAGLDSRVGVPRGRHPRFYFSFCIYGH